MKSINLIFLLLNTFNLIKSFFNDVNSNSIWDDEFLSNNHFLFKQKKNKKIFFFSKN